MARVGYNHLTSNKGESNNFFSEFSNRVLLPIFISTILQSGKFLNLAHYFPYDVNLRQLAHSRSFLANQKDSNAIVGSENLLNLGIEAFQDFKVSLLSTHAYEDFGRVYLDRKVQLKNIFPSLNNA